MRIDLRKISIAAATSIALIAALLWAAEPSAIDLERLRPWGLVATVVAFVGVVGCRAATLRQLATPASRGSWSGWIRLAARHQLVFMLTPSGIGDLGFPVLARRYVGIGAAGAVRMIAQFRFRDILILVLLAIIGAVSRGADLSYALFAFAAGLAALYRGDDLAVFCLRIAARLFPGGAIAEFLENSVSPENVTARQRVLRTALAVITWGLIAFALFSGFAAVGKVLPFGDTLLMVAALNAVGAVAISIAGFGVAEAGVAGVLVGMGDSPASGAATALVARPVLLITMIVACAVLDLGVGLYCGTVSAGSRH